MLLPGLLGLAGPTAAADEPAPDAAAAGPASGWDHLTFTESSEGFRQLQDGAYSDIGWDAARGNLRLLSDRQDAVDEIYARPLTTPFDASSTSFDVSFDFEPHFTWDQQGYLLFLGPSGIRDVSESASTIAVRFYELPDHTKDRYVKYYDQRVYEVSYRDASGTLRHLDTFWYGHRVTYCINYPCYYEEWWDEDCSVSIMASTTSDRVGCFYITYNATEKRLTFEMSGTYAEHTEDNKAWHTYRSSYHPGQAPGDTFRLEEIGLASDAMGMTSTTSAWAVDGISIRWDTVSATPSQPFDLRATRTPGHGGANLSWTPPALVGNPAYHEHAVERRLGGDAAWARIAGTSEPSHLDVGPRFVARDYRVRAESTSGPGPWSNLATLPAEVPYGMSNYTFDDSAGGFAVRSNGSRADLRWDAEHGRVHVRGHDDHPLYETFSRAPAGGMPWTPDASFFVTARWQVTEEGKNMGAFPIFLSRPDWRSVDDVPGSVFVEYHARDRDLGERPAYWLGFRDAGGTLRASDVFYGVRGAEYVFNISYDSATRRLTLTADEVGVGRVATRGFDVGPSDFAFTEVGVQSLGWTYTGLQARPFTAWVDDIRLFRDPKDASDLPPPPVATAVGAPQRVELSWTPVDGATAYRVYRNASDAWRLVAETANASFTDALSSGVTYEHLVSAVGASGEGQPAIMRARTPAAPSAPLSLSAARGPSVGQITLTWEPPLDADGLPLLSYRVRANGSLVAEVPASTTSWTDTGLQENATRAYAVSAVTDAGEGAAALVSARAPSRPWHVVDLVAASGPGEGAITLSWKPPLDDGGLPLHAYRIERTGPTGDVTLLETSATMLVDSGLARNATYAYRVVAANDLGEGPARTTSGLSLALPTAPRDLTVAAGPGARQMKLTWTAPADTGGGAVKYRVVRHDASGPVDVARNLTATIFVDGFLTPDTVYTYSVVASNLAGDGPASTLESARTYAQGTPPAPTAVAAYTSLTRVRIEWTPADGGATQPATHWRIERAMETPGVAPSWTRVATVVASTLAYDDRPPLPGATYVYRITGLNDWGAGASSEPARAALLF